LSECIDIKIGEGGERGHKDALKIRVEETGKRLYLKGENK
jgi:hypothetical protein